MQHRRNEATVHSCARRGLVSPAIYAIALLLSCAWCAACAQGADQGGDDGGSDDSSSQLDTWSPVDSTTPPARDATGSSSGADAPVRANDAAEASMAAGGDASAEGAADSSADSPMDVGDVSVNPPADAIADGSGGLGGDAPADSGCGSCGKQSVCVAGVCTTARRVFVSSTTFTGNLGGATGADMKCNALATAASLEGSWMAWISDVTSSPSTRFIPATVAYRRLDGARVALNYASLGTGLENAIDIDEHGNTLGAPTTDASKTWTGTASSGAAGPASCTGFTVTTGTGAVGHYTATSAVAWTAAYSTENCSVANHLYCFEQ